MYLQIFELVQVLHDLQSYSPFFHSILALANEMKVKALIRLQYLISNYLKIQMKKKLSLLIRRKPARKIIKTEHVADSPMRDREECASAKKYLFSLDEEEETIKSVSLISQFKTNRKQADLSISKWSPIKKQEQRYNCLQINTSKSRALEKKQLQFQTTQEESFEDESQRRNQHVKKSINAQLTPKIHEIKFFKKDHTPQNLSQFQYKSFRQNIPSDLHQVSTSNKSNCLKTLQLKLKFQNTREVYPKNTSAVPFFDLSLDQISILKNKTEKTQIKINKIKEFSMETSKTLEKFRQNVIIDQRGNRVQKKKFEIIFVRHKLRKQQGLWLGEQKWCKDIMSVASRKWALKDKCK